MEDFGNNASVKTRIMFMKAFRNITNVVDLQVIDMLLFKGMEELKNVVDHSKQRHHIIGQYVVGQHEQVPDSASKDPAISPFLKNFYSSNYF